MPATPTSSPYRPEHPREIGLRLKQFVDVGWLVKEGHGRGTRYRWPARRSADLFGGSGPSQDFRHNAGDSQHSAFSSQHSGADSQHTDATSQHKETLRDIAAPVRERGRAPPEEVRAVILAPCARQPLSLAELAGLIGRASEPAEPLPDAHVEREGAALAVPASPEPPPAALPCRMNASSRESLAPGGIKANLAPAAIHPHGPSDDLQEIS